MKEEYQRDSFLRKALLRLGVAGELRPCYCYLLHDRLIEVATTPRITFPSASKTGSRLSTSLRRGCEEHSVVVESTEELQTRHATAPSARDWHSDHRACLRPGLKMRSSFPFLKTLSHRAASPAHLMHSVAGFFLFFPLLCLPRWHPSVRPCSFVVLLRSFTFCCDFSDTAVSSRGG